MCYIQRKMLIVSAILEALLYYTPLWRWRRWVVAPVMGVVIAEAVWVGANLPHAVAVVYGSLALCRLIHLLRLIKNRTHEARLHDTILALGPGPWALLLARDGVRELPLPSNERE